MRNLEFVKKIHNRFENKISPIEKYVSIRKTPFLKFKCNVNDNHPIFEASTLHMTRNNNHHKGCPVCVGLYKTNFNKKSINKHLRNKFNGRIELISDWEMNKTTGGDVLLFNCRIHGDFKSRLNFVEHYSLGCSKCAYDEHHNSVKEESIQKLKNHLVGTGIIFDDSDFINMNTKMKFKYGDIIFERTPGKIIYENRINPPHINVSNGEMNIIKILNSLNISFEKEFIFDDLKNINNLRFDFMVNENILIEFDGSQHHDDNSIYYSEDILKSDEMKEKYIRDNNLSLIRFIKQNTKPITDSQYNTIKESIIEFISSPTTIAKIKI